MQPLDTAILQRMGSVDGAQAAEETPPPPPQQPPPQQLPPPPLEAHSLAAPSSATLVAPQGASTSTAGSDLSPQSTESSASGVTQAVMAPSASSSATATASASASASVQPNTKEMLEGLKTTLEAAMISQKQQVNPGNLLPAMPAEGVRSEQPALESAAQGGGGEDPNKKRADDRLWRRI